MKKSLVVYKREDATKTIGGKAKGLFRLIENGVNVPDFLVVPAEVFDPVILEIKAEDEQGLSLRKKELASTVLNETIKDEINKILKSWNFPQQSVIIRSSIADEDGVHDAFPGMMDSFLNIKTTEEVFSSIVKCASSSYSERAIAYRNQRKLSLTARPAVIVQKQITADSSGVIFTTFPEYPQELAIHAVWGLGEGLMSGFLEPDEFYILKKTAKIHRQKVAEKKESYTAEKGSGIAAVEVHKDKINIPCLTEPQLHELGDVASKLEKDFKGPQDIEFVVEGKNIFIVQSRPITQAIPEPVVYDNSNIQESYCGVTTPLTFSFASRAYATVYTQTMSVLGISKKVILENEATVNQLLGLIKGRIYYNINNWYKGLQLLPSFKQNKEDMERMMGLPEPVDFVEDKEKDLKAKFVLLPSLIINLAKLLWAFRNLNTSVTKFHAHFKIYYEAFYKLPLTELSGQDLVKQKKVLDEILLRNWTTPIINDFYVMMTNGQTVRKLKKAGIENVDEFLSYYLSGDKEIDSTLPVTEMQRLATTVMEQDALRKLILEAPDDLHQQVLYQFPAFYYQIMDFIDIYGDRTVGELKLETLTMRVDNAIFYKYLRNYISIESPVLKISNAPLNLHDQAVDTLSQLLETKSFIFRKNLAKNLKNLQKAIRFRESLRLERTRLFGMYRSLFLAMGKVLEDQGVLKDKRDVFYLSEEDIEKSLSQAGFPNAPIVIKERKEEFSGFKKEDVPSRVVIPSPPVEQELLVVDKKNIKGTGCYPGTVQGTVIVISNPEDDMDVNGKIVCALRTDPGWAALFPSCKAVLIEKGSSLSHSVILLRELSIPTIINIPGLTKMLKSGDHVKIDGGSGDIKVIDTVLAS